MNQIAAKDSKAKILDAFRQILAERQKIESKVATIEEEAQKAENQRVLEAASQYTADISKQLDAALKQVQDLAVKAIEGAANVSSFQAVKDIAIEQAKNQAKNK